MYFILYKRLRTLLKVNVSLTIFTLLLVIFAFSNFFILLSLRTNFHHKSGSWLETVYSFDIHETSSVPWRDHEERDSKNIVYSRQTRVIRPNMSGGIIATNMQRGKAFNSGNETGTGSNKTLNVFGQVKSNDTWSSVGNTMTNLNISSKENYVKPRQSTTPNVNDNCTLWCYRGNALKPPYLLTAVLLVRIYRHDLAKLSSRELVQWLQYLRYAGFQHVYIYDSYVEKSESQREVLKAFVQSGFVTYIDWSKHNPYSIQGTQVSAYQDCINKFGKDSTWQAAIDIDEYPISPYDLNENFMSRFVTKYARIHPDVSEITMKNFLMLGKFTNDVVEPFLIARIRRITKEPANALVKPIYKPGHVAWAQVHHNGMKNGLSRSCPESMLRMNHYWGARLQNWGNDTPKVLTITKPDYTIEPIVERIKSCASYLGKDSLFVKRWA